MKKQIYDTSEYTRLENEAKEIYPDAPSQQLLYIKSKTSDTYLITAWILKNVQELSALRTGVNLILSSRDIDLIFRAFIDTFDNMTASLPSGTWQYLESKLSEPAEHILKTLETKK